MLSKSKIISEVQQCLVLAVPLAAAQLAQSATAFADTVMMGWLGSQTIASGGLGAVTFTFCLLVCSGIVSAVSPIVAEAYGAGKTERLGWIMQQGLWLSLILGIPITALLWHGGTFLRLIGQDPNTVALTETYLRTIAWGFLPGLGFAVLRSFISALSRPRPVMVTVFLGTLLNITANYVLMFGKFGFPTLGLAGIGWASTLSLWSMLIGLGLYLFKHPHFQQYGLFPWLPSNRKSAPTKVATAKESRQILGEIVRVGLPIGGLLIVEAGLFTVVTFLIGGFSTTALAAHQIALQMAALSFQIALGVALATTVRVGQLAGEQNQAGVRLAGYVGMTIGALCMGSLGVAFWLVPEWIVSLYLNTRDPANREVTTIAVQLLGVAAVFQIVDGIQATAVGALRGLKDTRVPMLIGVFAYWCVGLSTGCWLGFKLGYGAVGLWWGLAIGLAIAAIVLTWRFNRLKLKPSLAEKVVSF
jgi:multidrug resistance protein, MATE family